MNRHEFIDHVGKYSESVGKGKRATELLVTLKDNDYDTIEYVYNWHPSISNVEGKAQIAMLYVEFGMRVIEDMKATAVEVHILENDILAARHKLEELEEERRKWN